MDDFFRGTLNFFFKYREKKVAREIYRGDEFLNKWKAIIVVVGNGAFSEKNKTVI